MPTLAYSPNRASADLPGTIGLSNEVFWADARPRSRAGDHHRLQERDDHGRPRRRSAGGVRRGRQKLDARYAPQGKHVYFVDEVYKKAQDDFDDWLVAHGYPRSSHAGIPDTSTMLYLGGDKGWVRKELIPTAEGDPVPPPARADRTRRCRSQRAAAEEQRHLGRRAPFDRRARQAGIRHQGQLRGEADHRLPRQISPRTRRSSNPAIAGLRKVKFAEREG